MDLFYFILDSDLNIIVVPNNVLKVDGRIWLKGNDRTYLNFIVDKPHKLKNGINYPTYRYLVKQLTKMDIPFERIEIYGDTYKYLYGLKYNSNNKYPISNSEIGNIRTDRFLGVF